MQRLEGRQPRPFTLVAVAGRMTVDEARIKCAQLLPAHTQALHRAEPHIVVNHVGALDQRMDNLAAGFALEVNGDALLAALDAEKNAQLRTAHWIAAVLFDLDHARPK